LLLIRVTGFTTHKGRSEQTGKTDTGASNYHTRLANTTKIIYLPSKNTSSTRLKRIDFMNSSESYSCCLTDDGGIPLDMTLKQLLIHPGGFFIESGGNDGVTQSNTLIFERLFGWYGILIEPSSSNIPKLLGNRPTAITVHAALTSLGKNGDLVGDLSGSLMGSLKDVTDQVGKNTVSRSLSSILDELSAPHVDFWSLDIEGYELNALQGVDWTRHRPTFILIEVWKDEQNALEKVMQSVNYIRCPGMDNYGSVSGWSHYTKHRDFLFMDSTNFEKNEKKFLARLRRCFEIQKFSWKPSSNSFTENMITVFNVVPL